MALFGRLVKKTPVAAAQSIRATHVGFNYRIVTKSLVETCHQRGLVVFVYTVNKRGDIQKQKSLGVDGIISDFPDRL
jgi:glycerophosphoryl diester phosphodiesterase